MASTSLYAIPVIEPSSEIIGPNLKRKACPNHSLRRMFHHRCNAIFMKFISWFSPYSSPIRFLKLGKSRLICPDHFFPIIHNPMSSFHCQCKPFGLVYYQYERLLPRSAGIHIFFMKCMTNCFCRDWFVDFSRNYICNFC